MLFIEVDKFELIVFSKILNEKFLHPYHLDMICFECSKHNRNHSDHKF